jgi:hypothetical protein
MSRFNYFCVGRRDDCTSNAPSSACTSNAPSIACTSSAPSIAYSCKADPPRYAKHFFHYLLSPLASLECYRLCPLKIIMCFLRLTAVCSRSAFTSILLNIGRSTSCILSCCSFTSSGSRNSGEISIYASERNIYLICRDDYDAIP